MTKSKGFKCWRKNYSNELASNWIKLGKVTNETLRPMMDIRLISLEDKRYRLETFDIGNRKKFREVYNTKKQAEKRAVQIMKKHDRC